MARPGHHFTVENPPRSGPYSTVHRRHLQPALLRALTDTPVVLVNGARQVGKTTRVQAIPGRRYLNLDDATILAGARSDPTGFLAGLQGPVTLDEVQKAPELFPAIKAAVDRSRRPGRLLLTDSTDVLLLPRLSTRGRSPPGGRGGTGGRDRSEGHGEFRSALGIDQLAAQAVQGAARTRSPRGRRPGSPRLPAVDDPRRPRGQSGRVPGQVADDDAGVEKGCRSFSRAAPTQAFSRAADRPSRGFRFNCAARRPLRERRWGGGTKYSSTWPSTRCWSLLGCGPTKTRGPRPSLARCESFPWMTRGARSASPGRPCGRLSEKDR